MSAREIAALGERTAIRQTARAADHLSTVYTKDGCACGRLATFAGGAAWLTKDPPDPEPHWLRTLPAWKPDADHVELLPQARGFGVKLVTVNRMFYEVVLADLDRDGFVIDRGRGQQVALPLGRWRACARGGQ